VVAVVAVAPAQLKQLANQLLPAAVAAVAQLKQPDPRGPLLAAVVVAAVADPLLADPIAAVVPTET